MRHWECNHPFGNVSKGVPSVMLVLLPLALFIYSVKTTALSLISLFSHSRSVTKLLQNLSLLFGFHIVFGFVSRLSTTG